MRRNVINGNQTLIAYGYIGAPDLKYDIPYIPQRLLSAHFSS